MKRIVLFYQSYLKFFTSRGITKKKANAFGAGVLLIVISVFFIYGHSNKAIEIASVDLKDGDIIFQNSQSKQSAAIERATNSPYSHVGIIYLKNGSYYVYEAIQPVQLTPFSEWIKRGEGGHYVVKRLKNYSKVFTTDIPMKMKNAAQKYNGKDYDSFFEWSDEKMYCSELVWKVYRDATGIEIGELQQLRELNLSDSLVQATVKERYGNKIPMNELVISPASIFNSELLLTVVQN